MNKKRLGEFSRYLEGFSQRLVARFPESNDFVTNEGRQMLERFPELSSSHQPRSEANRASDKVSVIEYTFKGLSLGNAS